MKVTEEQAKKVQCCGPQGCGFEHAAAAGGDGQRYCIGSRCMAWRWTEPMVDGPDSYQSEPKPVGFCGLAGFPFGGRP